MLAAVPPVVVGGLLLVMTFQEHQEMYLTQTEHNMNSADVFFSSLN